MKLSEWKKRIYNFLDEAEKKNMYIEINGVIWKPVQLLRNLENGTFVCTLDNMKMIDENNLKTRKISDFKIKIDSLL